MLRLIAERGFSQRRACELIGIDPRTVRRETGPGNGDLRDRLRSLATERRRFGYRRLGSLLEREGIHMKRNMLDTSKNRVCQAGVGVRGSVGSGLPGFARVLDWSNHTGIDRHGFTR